MAILKEKTVVSLTKDTATSITLPTVPAGLTAKILALEVWSPTGLTATFNLYDDTTLVQTDGISSSESCKKRLLCCDISNFYDPADLSIKATESGFYATAYYILE